MARRKRKKRRSKTKTTRRGSASQAPNETLPLPDMRMLEAALDEVQSTDPFWDEDSPIARAQDIVYEAFEARGDRQVELAQEALSICPDCTDAYVLLAENTANLNRAVEFYRQGIAAAERILGQDTFRRYEGKFWGVLETRPYMRAKLGLAQCLLMAGRREESVEHLQEMLRLNPSDNQGVRWILARCLLELGRDDELKRLLAQYAQDATATWAYTRALLAFRQHGDSTRCRELLAAATECNEHVPLYLLGDRPLPRRTPDYFSPGDADEAALYAVEFLPGWKATPGAISWLRKAAKIGLPQAVKPPAGLSPAAKDALMDLPQVEDELWQADVRRLPAMVKIDRKKMRPWSMLVTNCSENEISAMEISPERPSDEDLCEVLVQAMLRPVSGEPHRPKTIQVSTKKRCKAWQSDLADIGIDCTYLKPLKHVDLVFDQIESFLPAGGGLPEEPRVAGDAAELSALPQEEGAIWQADMLPMPTWIEVDGEPTRPWLVMVTDRTHDLVLAHDLCPQLPHPEMLWEQLSQAMRSPMAGPSYRPGEVQLRSEDHRHVLRGHLEAIGVRCVVSDQLDQLDCAYDSLANHMASGGTRSALVDAPGAGPEQVGSYFEAAAGFYRQAPWRRVPGDTVIKVECEKFESGPWYAVVMGQSGMTEGLALYDDLEMLQTMLSGRLSDEEAGRRTSALSVTFGEEFTVAIPDLEAAEQFGWPVAGPEAYPSAMRVNPGKAIRAPLGWELELLEGCLRAIPEFVADDDPAPKRIEVPVGSGSLKLALSWPDDK